VREDAVAHVEAGHIQQHLIGPWWHRDSQYGWNQRALLQVLDSNTLHASQSTRTVSKQSHGLPLSGS
jgi:hypothetical protein